MSDYRLQAKPDVPSFPEFFARKILRESMRINTVWIALEFALRQIQAMTEREVTS